MTYYIFNDQSIPLEKRKAIADAALHHANCMVEHKMLSRNANYAQKLAAIADIEIAEASLGYCIRAALQSKDLVPKTQKS